MLSRLQLKNITTHHVGPVDLTVAAGTSISLRGSSGSGKSLLLRAIADLDPHHGEVLLDEVACLKYSGSQWRQLVGYLPAVSQWWGDNVREHFNDDIDHPLLSIWLKILQLSGNILDAPTATLSSGERQRLALLRMLANKPQVLLLDEPTASLDPENARCVETLIADYQSQHHCAIIWVSHDPQQCQRVATRHYVIEQGKLLLQAEGTWN